MSQRNIKNILLAVNFEKPLKNIFAFAQDLTKNLDASLHVMHVCEPWTDTFFRKKLKPEKEMVWQAIADEQARVTHERFQFLKQHACLPESQLHFTVRFGEVIDEIITTYEEISADLLILHYHNDPQDFMKNGHGLTIEIIEKATHIPILVFNPHGNPQPFNQPRILLADDLAVHSAGAVSLAYEWLQAWPNGQLIHCYVIPDLETIDQYIQQQRIEERNGQQVPLPHSPALIQDFIGEAARKFDEKYAVIRHEVKEKNRSYQDHFCFGKPQNEIQKTANAWGADFVIYGRHEALHRQPFGLGHIPHKMMLTQPRHICIVPVDS